MNVVFPEPKPDKYTNLIDPNEVDINPNIPNGIPQYQDMHIFAELTAVRKARTVLYKMGDSSVYTEKATGLEETIRVNFLGNNQNKGITVGDKFVSNPHYLQFTTNYYQGSTGNETQYEGFGISDIKIVINSSFVPQINIQFVDIRGVALFNQQNSPYRVLFDFPPPIFDLTIKGYYGKPLMYKLHLVKYTSEFKSENGNFVVDAQFIAMTYAPLTDVLFKYAINFPLMKRNIQKRGDSSSPAPENAPKNTDDLIIKLKALMPAIAKAKNESSESEKYNSSVKRIEENNAAINMIGAFRQELQGSPFLLLQDNSPENPNGSTSKVSVLNNTTEYNNYILQQVTTDMLTGSGVPKRLFIAYYIGQDIALSDSVSANGTTGTLTKKYKDQADKLIEDLNKYRSNLIDKLRKNNATVQFDDSDIATAELFPDGFDTKNNINVKDGLSAYYVGIDITNLYSKLQKNKSYLIDDKFQSASAINVSINNIIFEELGMMPTIYNIFKIILDDVDVFFETIRQTSIKAENEHHNTNVNYRIITGGDYFDSLRAKRVFAFPLIINVQGQVCGGSKQEKIAPIELSNRTEGQFPEIELINEFIDTFFLQDFQKNLPNLKGEEDDAGNKLWIPISPMDSSVASNSVSSPYPNIEGIGTNGSTYDGLSEILKIMLQRFYILSQGVLSESFYSPDYQTRNLFGNLFAQSEAVNLATSVVNPEKRNLLKQFITEGEGKTPQSFYEYLRTSKVLSDIYRSNNNISFPLSNQDDVYVDKNNTEFKGAYIIPDGVSIAIQADDKPDETTKETEGGKKDNTTTDKPIQQFMSDVKKNKWFDGLRKYPQGFFSFTQDNILYIEDTFRKFKTGEIKGTMEYTSDNICLDTRYLSDTKRTISEKQCNELLSAGNVKMPFLNDRGLNDLKQFQHMVDDVWVKELSEHDEIIHKAIMSGSSKFSALMFLSNVGYTLGPFNMYPKNLGYWIFQNPAIIEVPRYLPAYIGALVGADNDTSLINELKEFFINGDGKNLNNNGQYIFADIYDINHFLSEKDKELFRGEYDDFMSNVNEEFAYYQLKTSFDYMFSKISGNTVNKKEKEYTQLLNPKKTQTGAPYYNLIIKPLLERVKLANYTELTFKRDSGTTSGNKTYKSLAYTNSNVSDAGVSTQPINNAYFTQFFAKLNTEIDKKTEENKEQEEKNRRLKSDDSIITQTYYSFKNINDKWLVNPISTKTFGYPFNEDGKNLIDSFVFVDRAMNPIGDTVINPEPLIQMAEDPNISVFTVISQLLSANGFEFFPLQNFMSFNEDEWKECFRISNAPMAINRQTFVCMYIGGSSSYPSNINNDFADDGIIDLESDAPSDFNTADCSKTIDNRFDNQMNTNPDFPWRQVRAFRVRFGEQNQSMFKDIKIDSKEFPETNESINILSRLAGDGGASAPVPQGQNLYNIYENRAYRATVGGLGNAMIQPTQYFQLENVPMFNGAYLILTVEHNISPNKMTTTFSGTKILKFPYPRVTNPAAIFGLKDGYIGDITTDNMSAGNYIQNFGGAQYLDNLSKVTSMYGLKIQ